MTMKSRRFSFKCQSRVLRKRTQMTQTAQIVLSRETDDLRRLRHLRPLLLSTLRSPIDNVRLHREILRQSKPIQSRCRSHVAGFDALPELAVVVAAREG